MHGLLLLLALVALVESKTSTPTPTATTTSTSTITTTSTATENKFKQTCEQVCPTCLQSTCNVVDIGLPEEQGVPPPPYFDEAVYYEYSQENFEILLTRYRISCNVTQDIVDFNACETPGADSSCHIGNCAKRHCSSVINIFFEFACDISNDDGGEEAQHKLKKTQQSSSSDRQPPPPPGYIACQNRCLDNPACKYYQYQFGRCCLGSGVFYNNSDVSEFGTVLDPNLQFTPGFNHTYSGSDTQFGEGIGDAEVAGVCGNTTRTVTPTVTATSTETVTATETRTIRPPQPAGERANPSLPPLQPSSPPPAPQAPPPPPPAPMPAPLPPRTNTAPPPPPIVTVIPPPPVRPQQPSTPPPPPPVQAQSSSPGGSNAGAIAGGVAGGVGGLCLVFLIGCGLYMCFGGSTAVTQPIYGVNAMPTTAVTTSTSLKFAGGTGYIVPPPSPLYP